VVLALGTLEALLSAVGCGANRLIPFKITMAAMSKWEGDWMSKASLWFPIHTIRRQVGPE
jgi:hypothetical protein